MFPSFNPNPDRTFIQKLIALDWDGGTLNIRVWVIFMVILTMAGSRYSWNSAFSISLWAIWAIIAVVFALRQKLSLFTESRIFPVHFLQSRIMVLLYITTGSAAGAFVVTLYYIPAFFQFAHNCTALDAAVRLLQFIVVFIFSLCWLVPCYQ